MKFWGRLICGIGGLALAGQAFVPTYAAGAGRRPRGDWIPGVVSPFDVWVAEPRAMWLTWIVLLPNLLGLHAVALAAGHRPGPLALKIHRFFLWAFVVAYCYGVFVTVLVTLGLLASLQHAAGGFALSLGAFVAGVVILTLAWRVLRLSRMPSALAALVLYQALLLLAAAPLLVLVVMNQVTPGSLVGVGAWAVLLVGSHLWLRALVHESRGAGAGGTPR